MAETDRERDVEIAVSQGWQGPVQWVEDDDGRDPYLYPPDALGQIGAIVDDPQFNHIVPRFSAGSGWACACHTRDGALLREPPTDA